MSWRLRLSVETILRGNGADAGRRMHFVDHGPRVARAVLLLHGNPTWSG